VWTEGALPDLLHGLGRPLLHHLIDGERLPKEPLALRRLDGRTTNIDIANHHDREAFGLPGLRVDGENRILDGREG
jgi:hypothetical protein